MKRGKPAAGTGGWTRRRLVAGAGALGATGLLAACGATGGDGSAPGASPSKGPVTIRARHKSPGGDIWERMVADQHNPTAGGWLGNPLVHMLGERGLFAKNCFYEGSWRVPLTVRHPAHNRPGARLPALASLVDLYPTIAESLGLDVPGNVHGRSQLPALRGEHEQVHVHVHGELHGRGAPDHNFGIFDGEWKLSMYADDRDELHHLPSDPREHVNRLHDAPEHAARLREAHTAWLRATS
jgi:arylsulfatase A-like enzyme